MSKPYRLLQNKNSALLRQMGDDVLHAAIEEYAHLTGIVLDEEIIRFWDRVHFVNYASGSAMRSFPDDSREILTRELKRVYPDHDWREVSGEITYPTTVE